MAAPTDTARTRAATRSSSATRTSSADAILESLRPVVAGLAATFGRTVEVVLHDYRRPDRSVVEVAGSVTGRHVGGSISEIGLAMLARGDAATNELNYLTKTDDGTIIKSSTLPLRDDKGHVFGALCINVDVTALRRVSDVISNMVGTDAIAPPTTTFTDDFDEVVDAVIRAEELALGKPVASLTRQERLPLLKALDERGLFAVRSAAPRIAARLGISRASLYADRAEYRKDAADPDDTP